MFFFRFLELFLSAAERGPEAAWKYLFGMTSFELSEILVPEQCDHVVVFIRKMKLMIDSEGKRLSQQRSEALNRLLQYLNTKGEEGTYAERQVRWLLCFQLALRVREPQLISQRQVGICGPNSVAIAWARGRPVEYVVVALELHETGQCELEGGHYLARPSPKRAEKCRVGKMDYADILVMGAIKGRMDCGKLEQMLIIETPMHGNGGDRVCRLLEVIGCEVFENHTTVPLYPSSFPNETHHRTLLTNCRDAVDDRRNIVLICYNAESINTASRHRDYHGYQRGDFGGVPVIMPLSMDDFRSNSPGHSKAPVLYSNPHLKNKESANHWSIVCKMELDGTYVNLKVYTWGRTVRYRMLIEQFLKIFNGYVLGRFPDRN